MTSDFQMSSLVQSSSLRGNPGCLSSSRIHKVAMVIPSSPSRATSSTTILSRSIPCYWLANMLAHRQLSCSLCARYRLVKSRDVTGELAGSDICVSGRINKKIDLESITSYFYYVFQLLCVRVRSCVIFKLWPHVAWLVGGKWNPPGGVQVHFLNELHRRTGIFWKKIFKIE